ncbi:MAG: DUF2945 domain-containing protein [Rhodobacteraceae bacterium]|nr:DUF2945 domain-containing protein [Paracoccaceae bacterium]
MARNVGDVVKWNWGDGTGTGEITKVYTQNTTVTIKGTEVTRDASDECPAYLIEQNDGDEVLKSESEVSAA